MDDYGKIKQILKSFTGRMQLCTVNDDTIALVYLHFLKNIHRLSTVIQNK
jgi:hypothetical protein